MARHKQARLAPHWHLSSEIALSPTSSLLRCSLLIVGSWIGLAPSVLAQNPAPALLPPAITEAGQPFFEVFTPRDYQGHGQVWTAAEGRTEDVRS